MSGHHTLRVIVGESPLGNWPRPTSKRDRPRIGSFRDPFSSSGCQPLAPGTVTVVCAPAGSGKTVLLRSWAAETDEAVAWVTVERGERDAQRFWLHVIDALADAAGDDVIERVSPAPGFAGAVVVERLLAPAGADRGAARTGDRRPARARLGRRARLAGDADHPATGTGPDPARDARGAGAGPASPEARGRADGAAWARPALLARRNPRAVPRRRDHSVGSGRGLAARTHRGMGGRFAAGGDLAGRPPRPGALCIRVLRQRADSGGLPPRGGAGAPGAGGARPALAHVGPGARQRAAGRRAHRWHGGRGDPPAARRPERLRHRTRRRPYVVPLPPPVRRSLAPRIAAHRAGDDPLAAPRRGRLARTGGRRRRSRPPLSSGR